MHLPLSISTTTASYQKNLSLTLFFTTLFYNNQISFPKGKSLLTYKIFFISLNNLSCPVLYETVGSFFICYSWFAFTNIFFRLVSVHPRTGDEQHERDGSTACQHLQNVVAPNIRHPSSYRMATPSVSCPGQLGFPERRGLGIKGRLKKCSHSFFHTE